MNLILKSQIQEFTFKVLYWRPQRTLESLAQQSVQRLEMIVVDGSDGKERICEA